MTDFNSLGLAAPILRALQEAGHNTPTPIQLQAIPPVLGGQDVLGIAQTGTGKTAAFALPLLHRLAHQGGRPPRGGCRVLILSPTRELAAQIQMSLKSYGRHLGLSSAVVVGGVPAGGQRRALGQGVDVLVATPGRLLDLARDGTARLDHVSALVLDEADQMLDRGFLPDIRRLVAMTPPKRQTMLFSATMPDEIAKLAAGLLREPVRVSVAPVATTVEQVTQRLILVEQAGKRAMLAELLRAEGVGRALVFARTKHGADRVVKQLAADGISASPIHGNRSQGQRERALAEFRDGSAPVLVATDIAARGIDVAGVTHVFQHDLPDVPETYVHRIGRTARAGAEGIAIALCAPDEADKWRAIEKLTRQRIAPEDRRADKRAVVATSPAEAHRHAPRGGRPQPRPHANGQHANAHAPQSHRPANGEGRRRRPDAPRAPEAGRAEPARKDRGWREGDFRDGGVAPGFLRGR